MVLGNATYNARLGSGQLVEFDFGAIGNPSDGDNADDYVTIEIVARIDNVAANQNDVARKNGEQAAGSPVTVTYGSGPTTTVTFDADGATPGIQGRALTVQEPVLATSEVGRADVAGARRRRHLHDHGEPRRRIDGECVRRGADRHAAVRHDLRSGVGEPAGCVGGTAPARS